MPPFVIDTSSSLPSAAPPAIASHDPSTTDGSAGGFGDHLQRASQPAADTSNASYSSYSSTAQNDPAPSGDSSPSNSQPAVQSTDVNSTLQFNSLRTSRLSRSSRDGSPQSAGQAAALQSNGASTSTTGGPGTTKTDAQQPTATGKPQTEAATADSNPDPSQAVALATATSAVVVASSIAVTAQKLTGKPAQSPATTVPKTLVVDASAAKMASNSAQLANSATAGAPTGLGTTPAKSAAATESALPESSIAAQSQAADTSATLVAVDPKTADASLSALVAAKNAVAAKSSSESAVQQNAIAAQTSTTTINVSAIDGTVAAQQPISTAQADQSFERQRTANGSAAGSNDSRRLQGSDLAAMLAGVGADTIVSPTLSTSNGALTATASQSSGDPVQPTAAQGADKPTTAVLTPATNNVLPNPQVGPNAPATQSSNGAAAAGGIGATPGSGMSDVDRVRFVQRVARAFQAADEQGGQIRLRLSPPDLGSMKLEITLRDGTMTAHVETETASARTLLLDHLPALRDRLAEHDIKIDRFDIDLKNRSGDGSSNSSPGYGDPGSSPPRTAMKSTGSTVAAIPSQPTASLSGGGGQLNVLI